MEDTMMSSLDGGNLIAIFVARNEDPAGEDDRSGNGVEIFFLKGE